MRFTPQQGAVTAPGRCCLPGTLAVRAWKSRVFIRAHSLRHHLPSTCQNSRLPNGKQVFNINQVVCTNNLGTTVSHTVFSPERDENSLELQVSQCQPMANPVNRAFRGHQSGLRWSLFPAGSQMHSWSLSSNPVINLTHCMP